MIRLSCIPIVGSMEDRYHASDELHLKNPT